MHPEVWESLLRRRGQLPHALLLTGQRGVGKFALARAFAALLLCEASSSNTAACGECLACKWFLQGNHPDFRLIRPAAWEEEEEAEEPKKGETSKADSGAEKGKKASRQIVIEQIRGLDDFLHVGTHRQGLRIVLIHPAEAMNRASANSLLKSLEEPVASTLFILVSDEADRLLPTIRSRCQKVAVPLPEGKIAAEALRSAGVDDAGRWLALAGGAPLLALELAQAGESESLNALLGVLRNGGSGVFDPLQGAALLDQALKKEKGAAAPMKQLIEWGQKWLFDLNLAAVDLPPRYFVAEKEQLSRLSRAMDHPRFLQFLKKALEYKEQSEHPLNTRLFLEDFLMNYGALFAQRKPPLQFSR
ncbi:MAG: DNA polymerase III subunit delta' [Betaproteobacteria bacterium]|nr:DNA polymerase III subunit delta' [Betaproteobacteria bacterium]